jgi:putative MATE family efflux protein
MHSEQNFTAGPILRPLLKFTLPVLLAVCLQAMYGAVDLAVVGWFGSAADVSAVSTGSQIMLTITFVITSLSMGTTILVGQKLGQGKSAEAGDVIGGGICLFLVVAAVVTAGMLIFSEPFTALMNAPKVAFSRTVSYVRICSAGSAFIVAYNVLGSVFRGLGDSRTPLITVLIACVCNIAGDLLLVGGLHMAAAGAALATILAQAISVILSFLLIRRRGLPFPFGRENIRFHGIVIRRTLALGVPIALQDALVSVSFLVILAIVNRLGVVYSAGIGIAEKLCIFIMLVPSAYMQSLSAFVAQNIGADRDDRARRAMLYGMLTSLCFGAVMSCLTFTKGNVLAGIFSRNDAQVVAAAWDYLKAYAIDALLVSFLFCFVGYFNGCGRTRFVMLEGIAGAFGVRIPVSYLMSRRTPVSLFHIGLATPCSTAVQIALCSLYFLWMHRRSEMRPHKKIRHSL